MLNLLAKSLSSSENLILHNVRLLPKGFTVQAYIKVFGDEKYIRSFVWTVFLTFVCTIVSLIMTTLCAYPLIFGQLRGRGLFNILITITMFFNAGMIPNYMLIQELHWIDTPFALIFPSCLSVYNMIIMRSFFYGIPDSLRESAEIDGASFITILLKIYIPLSKPVIATLALFYAVGRWNGYTDSVMYITNEKMYTLQHKLYTLVKNSTAIDTRDASSAPGLSDQLKSAVVMFSTVPILCVYPFLQKYFIHGVTLGAVKE